MAEWWAADLLDRRDYAKGELGTVTGGRLSWSAFRSVGGDGSLEVTLDDELDIDWLSDRVRISHHAEDGTVRPHGVWLISAPERQHDATGTRVTIGLSDKTELLAGDETGEWVTVPAGTNVVAWVAVKIQELTGEVAAVTASSATLRTALTWEPTETWLRVVNDLLAAVNYAALWADMEGRLRVEPYVAPGQRESVARYGFDDDDALMRSEWPEELPLWDLPTGVAVYTEGDEEAPGMSARADLPAAHPLSAARRGRTVTKSEEAEATSLDVLQGIAQRRLDEQMSIVYRAGVVHPVDDTVLNDVVEHGPAGVAGAIVNREITLGLGAVVTDSVRHIWTDMEDLPWL